VTPRTTSLESRIYVVDTVGRRGVRLTLTSPSLVERLGYRIPVTMETSSHISSTRTWAASRGTTNGEFSGCTRVHALPTFYGATRYKVGTNSVMTTKFPSSVMAHIAMESRQRSPKYRKGVHHTVKFNKSGPRGSHGQTPVHN
jgi:hypothetical protein